jgi:hypothetical protein
MKHHADAHEDAPKLRLDMEHPSGPINLWFGGGIGCFRHFFDEKM